jgi:uroporphyrinogen III methyltransferase/synthase
MPVPRSDADRSLADKRVLVLRPSKERDRTAEWLAARGAKARLIPLTVIEPTLDDPAVVRGIDGLLAGAYDLVAFTSDNAVRCFASALVRHGHEVTGLGRLRLAAVGPATAAALREVGLQADVVAGTFVAEGLVDAILALEPPPRSVLFPRAEVAREVLPEALRARGITVDVAPVYRTVEASPERAAELQAALPECDAILLTASSTVEQLCRCLGEAAATLLEPIVLASIGPVTTATAEARGLCVAVTATESTIPSLIDALARHFASSR